MSPPLLSIKHLHFAFGDHVVVDKMDLDLFHGEILFILGPSGCGKSTLLRAIAGLEEAQRGEILLSGTAISGRGTFMAPEERPIGMVFQGLALFPHLTVAGNVGFGLHRLTKAERAARVNAELASVGLSGLAERYPHQLSGGQQQRVAIARSLVLRPKVLLMDEPFSDLDGTTRREVRREVLRILREHNTAAIIVSHDHEDALHLADRIVRMEEGHGSRSMTPNELRAELSEIALRP